MLSKLPRKVYIAMNDTRIAYKMDPFQKPQLYLKKKVTDNSKNRSFTPNTQKQAQVKLSNFTYTISYLWCNQTYAVTVVRTR